MNKIRKILRIVRINFICIILFFVYCFIHEIGHIIAIIMTKNIFLHFEFTLTAFYTYWEKVGSISPNDMRFIDISGVLFVSFIGLFMMVLSYVIKNYDFFIGTFISIIYNLFYLMFGSEKGDGTQFMLSFLHPNYQLFYSIIIFLFIVMMSIFTVGLYKIISRRFNDKLQVL